jgi:hypothetical protein
VFWHSIGKLYQTCINDRFYCVDNFITLLHYSDINNATGARTMTEYSREHLIELLCRNDPNGCYTDYACDIEDMPHMTPQEAYDLCVEQELFN